jgi:hypothetical protein
VRERGAASHVVGIAAQLVEHGTAKLVARLLVEEIFKLKRALALGFLHRVQRRLRITMLERLDDEG